MSLSFATAAFAGTWDSELEISLSWGINASNTGTALYAETADGGETPFDAAAFEAGPSGGTRRFALLCAGDGAWIDGEGWTSTQWLDTEPRTRDDPNGLIWVRECRTGFFFPVTFFGAWDDLPEEVRAARLAEAKADKNKGASVDAEDWAKKVFYEVTWRSRLAVAVVAERPSHDAWALAEAPGLSAFELGSAEAPLGTAAGVSPLEIASQVWYPVIFGSGIPPNPRNLANIRVSTPSGKAYIGAKLPRKCVWMADFGLSRADLAQYPASIVRRAVEAWLPPDDPSLQSTVFMLR